MNTSSEVTSLSEHNLPFVRIKRHFGVEFFGTLNEKIPVLKNVIFLAHCISYRALWKADKWNMWKARHSYKMFSEPILGSEKKKD